MPYNESEGNDESMGRRKQGRRGNGHGSVTLRGNVFFARYTDALGKRREVSTHTSNRDEALKILSTYTAPIRESRSEDEIKLRLQHEIDVLELREEIDRTDRIELSSLVEKFVAHRALADSTEDTRYNYGKYIKKLVEVINGLFPSIRYIDEVNAAVVDGAMDLLAKHYTAATFNLALSTYRRCWSLFCRKNPFMKVSKRRIDRSRHRISIGDDEVRNIFNSCVDDVERAIWACGVYLGLRCVDICLLTYGSLGNDLSTVTCVPVKTKRHMPEPLVIPVCDALKRMLVGVLDMNKIGNPEFRDLPLWEFWRKKYLNRTIQRRFSNTLTKAGIPVSHIDGNGHRTIDTGFHVTRHYFVSTASKFMSPLLVQKIVGHSAINMTEHYFHANEDEIRKGLEQMPDFSTSGQNNIVKQNADQITTLEVMAILNANKDDSETPVEFLKRLIDISCQELQDEGSRAKIWSMN